MFALVSDNVIASLFLDNFGKKESCKRWLIIDPRICNSCIWTSLKKNLSLILILGLRTALAFIVVICIFRVLLRTLSRDTRIEDCESWFVPLLVLLPRLNRIKTNWKFSGLRADRRHGAGRLWFSWNPLTSCSNEFYVGCNWTRQRDRFNTISTLLCRSINSLHNVLGVLRKNGWRY